MNNKLIANTNERCQKYDTLHHLGDYMFSKSAQAEELITFKESIDKIIPTIYFYKGNHDENNKVKTNLLCSVLKFSHFKYLLIHIPPNSKDFDPEFKHLLLQIDCVLCGHVHNAWKWSVFTYFAKKIPVINVGVDVWNFRPVKMDEINNLFLSIKRKIKEK